MFMDNFILKKVMSPAGSGRRERCDWLVWVFLLQFRQRRALHKEVCVTGARLSRTQLLLLAVACGHMYSM